MRLVVRLLILAAGLLTIGRILTVPGPYGPNDMSRWATLVALIQTGDYSIGRRIENPDGTYQDMRAPVHIDILLDPQTKKFYSSKPPLLPTLLAWEVRLIRAFTAWDLRAEALSFLRILLLTFNALPIVLYLVALALLFGREANAGAEAALVVTAAFGTFATTFATTITNHVPATAAAGVALWALAAVWRGDLRARWFLLAGFASAFTASQEIPALAFPLFVGLAAGLRDRTKTLLLFLPAASIPLAAFWLTNQAALGRPFFFYGPDPAWSKFEGSYWLGQQSVERDPSAAYVFHFTLGHHGIFSLSPIFLFAAIGMACPFTERPGRALASCAAVLAAIALLRFGYKTGGLPLVVVMAPLGAGAAYLLAGPRGWWREREGELWPRLAGALTLLTLGFYLIRTSNYGGNTSGPRWLMWLTPLWLVAAVRPLEAALASSRWRWVAIAAIAVSIFSAVYGYANPWVHPWIFELTAAP